MTKKTMITSEVADPTQGMPAIMESVHVASSKRAERSNERLVGESLSAPFNQSFGDLRAETKLFNQLTEMALRNATKIAPLARPLREMVESNGIEGVPAPPHLSKILGKMGRQASVDVRVFPESGGVCVVGMWAPEAMGNGTFYPYTIHEATQEKRICTFNDSGKIYKYEVASLDEAYSRFDQEVPIDKRFGEPEVSMTIVRETADFDTPFQVVQVTKEGMEKCVGTFDSPRRAFQKLVEMCCNDLSGKIVGKSTNVWLTSTDKEAPEGDPFKPVKIDAGLARSDFQYAESSGKKILIGVSSKHEGSIVGNLGAVDAKGVKVGSIVTIERLDNGKKTNYFGHVLDVSEALVFAEMSLGNKMSPNEKNASIKLDPTSYNDHKDKPGVM